MSLILEALRRSEAERRRGQAPGLFVEQVALPSRRRAKTPAWAWAMAVALVVVLAAWGWREFGGRTEPASPAADAGASPPVVAPARATDPVAEAARATTEADTNEPFAVARDELDRGSPQEAVSTDPDLRPTAPEPASLPAPRTSSNLARNPLAEAQTPPDRAQTAPPPAGIVAASPAAAPVPAAIAPEPTAPAEEALPRLSELGADERSRLPPLKLSMHVYADEAAQRFVILDGKRLREGDHAGDGIVVEAIRRDGLVLSVHGRRLLLARP